MESVTQLVKVVLEPHPKYKDMQTEYFFDNEENARQSFRTTWSKIGRITFTKMDRQETSTEALTEYKVELHDGPLGLTTLVGRYMVMTLKNGIYTEPTHF